MSVKCNGKTWKQFYSDPSIWTENVWHDDQEITVNGKYEEYVDLDSILDSDIVAVSGGIVCGYKNEPSLEGLLRSWMKKLTTTSIVVEIHKDKKEEFIKLVKDFGGKIL